MTSLTLTLSWMNASPEVRTPNPPIPVEAELVARPGRTASLLALGWEIPEISESPKLLLYLIPQQWLDTGLKDQFETSPTFLVKFQWLKSSQLNECFSSLIHSRIGVIVPHWGRPLIVRSCGPGQFLGHVLECGDPASAARAIVAAIRCQEIGAAETPACSPPKDDTEQQTAAIIQASSNQPLDEASLRQHLWQVVRAMISGLSFLSQSLLPSQYQQCPIVANVMQGRASLQNQAALLTWHHFEVLNRSQLEAFKVHLDQIRPHLEQMHARITNQPLQVSPPKEEACRWSRYLVILFRKIFTGHINIWKRGPPNVLAPSAKTSGLHGSRNIPAANYARPSNDPQQMGQQIRVTVAPNLPFTSSNMQNNVSVLPPPNPRLSHSQSLATQSSNLVMFPQYPLNVDQSQYPIAAINPTVSQNMASNASSYSNQYFALVSHQTTMSAQPNPNGYPMPYTVQFSQTSPRDNVPQPSCHPAPVPEGGNISMTLPNCSQSLVQPSQVAINTKPTHMPPPYSARVLNTPPMAVNALNAFPSPSLSVASCPSPQMNKTSSNEPACATQNPQNPIDCESSLANTGRSLSEMIKSIGLATLMKSKASHQSNPPPALVERGNVSINDENPNLDGRKSFNEQSSSVSLDSGVPSEENLDHNDTIASFAAQTLKTNPGLVPKCANLLKKIQADQITKKELDILVGSLLKTYGVKCSASKLDLSSEVVRKLVLEFESKAKDYIKENMIIVDEGVAAQVQKAPNKTQQEIEIVTLLEPSTVQEGTPDAETPVTNVGISSPISPGVRQEIRSVENAKVPDVEVPLTGKSGPSKTECVPKKLTNLPPSPWTKCVVDVVSHLTLQSNQAKPIKLSWLVFHDRDVAKEHFFFFSVNSIPSFLNPGSSVELACSGKFEGRLKFPGTTPQEMHLKSISTYEGFVKDTLRGQNSLILASFFSRIILQYEIVTNLSLLLHDDRIRLGQEECVRSVFNQYVSGSKKKQVEFRGKHKITFKPDNEYLCITTDQYVILVHTKTTISFNGSAATLDSQLEHFVFGEPIECNIYTIDGSSFLQIHFPGCAPLQDARVAIVAKFVPYNKEEISQWIGKGRSLSISRGMAFNKVSKSFLPEYRCPYTQSHKKFKIRKQVQGIAQAWIGVGKKPSLEFLMIYLQTYNEQEKTETLFRETKTVEATARELDVILIPKKLANMLQYDMICENIWNPGFVTLSFKKKESWELQLGNGVHFDPPLGLWACPITQYTEMAIQSKLRARIQMNVKPVLTASRNLEENASWSKSALVKSWEMIVGKPTKSLDKGLKPNPEPFSPNPSLIISRRHASPVPSPSYVQGSSINSSPKAVTSLVKAQPQNASPKVPRVELGDHPILQVRTSSTDASQSPSSPTVPMEETDQAVQAQAQISVVPMDCSEGKDLDDDIEFNSDEERTTEITPLSKASRYEDISSDSSDEEGNDGPMTKTKSKLAPQDKMLSSHSNPLTSAQAQTEASYNHPSPADLNSEKSPQPKSMGPSHVEPPVETLGIQRGVIQQSLGTQLPPKTATSRRFQEVDHALKPRTSNEKDTLHSNDLNPPQNTVTNPDDAIPEVEVSKQADDSEPLLGEVPSSNGEPTQVPSSNGEPTHVPSSNDEPTQVPSKALSFPQPKLSDYLFKSQETGLENGSISTGREEKPELRTISHLNRMIKDFLTHRERLVKKLSLGEQAEADRELLEGIPDSCLKPLCVMPNSLSDASPLSLNLNQDSSATTSKKAFKCQKCSRTFAQAKHYELHVAKSASNPCHVNLDTPPVSPATNALPKVDELSKSIGAKLRTREPKEGNRMAIADANKGSAKLAINSGRELEQSRFQFGARWPGQSEAKVTPLKIRIGPSGLQVAPKRPHSGSRPIARSNAIVASFAPPPAKRCRRVDVYLCLACQPCTLIPTVPENLFHDHVVKTGDHFEYEKISVEEHILRLISSAGPKVQIHRGA